MTTVAIPLTKIAKAKSEYQILSALVHGSGRSISSSSTAPLINLSSTISSLAELPFPGGSSGDVSEVALSIEEGGKVAMPGFNPNNTASHLE
jgi:hypothetical protein